MSYCRFRNTLKDLQDCEEALYNENMNLATEENDFEWLDSEEYRAMESLIELCKDIANNN